ncbi:unnamed protein product [Heligmosomoides polygyrus]|uniref:Uncharacterized protein n=1 Tax=Heligmosomoides polygyrus TaxID=6339 RepID=A0A3P7U400_HELPZ|nr:unnamed protein product [Heligmosomoides polygyrus]
MVSCSYEELAKERQWGSGPIHTVGLLAVTFILSIAFQASSPRKLANLAVQRNDRPANHRPTHSLPLCKFPMLRPIT